MGLTSRVFPFRDVFYLLFVYILNKLVCKLCILHVCICNSNCPLIFTQSFQIQKEKNRYPLAIILLQITLVSIQLCTLFMKS